MSSLRTGAWLDREPTGLGPWRTAEPPSLLAKESRKLPAELPAEELGRGFGQEPGLGLRIELGKEPCMLLSKEPGKELSSLLRI